MKILDEMLTTWRQDSLSQLLECRRHLLYEEKALQLKVTQGTAIRIVSEAVCKVSIKLCRDIGQKADEQLAQLKRRLNASTLKDILEKDLNASDEMSEWLLAMVVHVLRNRSEWHANDRQKLAREVQAFLPTVSEAVRNSSIAQDARTEASSAWQAVLSGAVAGGTVGLIGGPEGVVVGAASGAAVAAVNWLKDSSRSWVTGNRGSELRRMELETGTYMFMALDKRGEERLLIFSVDSGSKTSEKGRAAAERLVNEMIQEKLRGDGRGRSDSRARSDSRGRGRSRTPPRRRSPSPKRRSNSRRRSPSRRGRSDSRRR
ncbi:unnamed protein product [Symbiodinium sp. KB8]|nr:unnamed protein product [Symbiodinium sp. KB8]